MRRAPDRPAQAQQKLLMRTARLVQKFGQRLDQAPAASPPILGRRRHGLRLCVGTIVRDH
jgi:hypothetical protein